MRPGLRPDARVQLCKHPVRGGLSNRRLVGVYEGLAHATGAAPLFTSAVSAFLAPGPAWP